ncbi:hypothetical protein RZS08_35600, partial [Arthrospira platensis SPKY1]|nr:hypothetical protein [Arthrospira platensis SPKY1]
MVVQGRLQEVHGHALQGCRIARVRPRVRLLRARLSAHKQQAQGDDHGQEVDRAGPQGHRGAVVKHGSSGARTSGGFDSVGHCRPGRSGTKAGIAAETGACSSHCLPSSFFILACKPERMP